MTAEYLTATVAIVLSLIFSYVPGVSSWFGNLSGDIKRLVMLVLLVLTAGVIFGLNCAGYGVDLGVIVSCDKAGGMAFLKILVTAIIANQSAYALSPGSRSRT